MRKKTLRTRIMCAILTLTFLVSLFQAPIPAAKAANTATIPVTIGNQTYQVTPGQNVTVNTPGGTTTYNVRFVDGKPVALDMTQVSSIIFGDAGSAASTGATTSQPATTSKPSTSSKPATQTSGATAQQSTNTTQTTTTTGSNSGKMTWNEFQKANSGKGMSSSEMSQAWKDYKAGNTTAQTSTPATQQTTTTQTAQQSTNTTQTSGATAQQSASSPAPQASVAEGAATTTNSSSSSQTTTKRAWDPAKHPRDPQTGRFISHEEAIARGLMDPADASTSTSSSSSQSSQTTQTTETAQTNQTSGQTSGSEAAQASTEASQAAQTTTTEQAAAPASGEKTKTSIGDKFKSGYQTGKNLTNAGFQNVKDSLKSGFSAKNLLVTAGITVGVDLATQIMRGEKPSLQKAVKTVCCAEFVGGVAGSVLGSAAGSFFVPFLSCVPVVGGALSALAPAFGSVVGSSVGAYMAGDLKNGRFSIKEAFKRVDWVGVTGQAIGSTVGAALGSCLGPVGTVLGGMVGGYFGNWAAHKIAGLFGKGEANLPQLTMPTTNGSMGYGAASANVSGGITLGGDDVTSVTISDAVPATEEKEEDPVVAAAEENDITTAYLEYTEYYNEYSELIQTGKTKEALEVAQKMNAAKAKYDSLRAGSEE